MKKVTQKEYIQFIFCVTLFLTTIVLQM